MKKLIIVVIAILALVACLVLARWADGNTRVPTPSSTPGSTSTATEPSSSSSATAPTPGEIENGLGWG